MGRTNHEGRRDTRSIRMYCNYAQITDYQQQAATSSKKTSVQVTCRVAGQSCRSKMGRRIVKKVPGRGCQALKDSRSCLAPSLPRSLLPPTVARQPAHALERTPLQWRSPHLPLSISGSFGQISAPLRAIPRRRRASSTPFFHSCED